MALRNPHVLSLFRYPFQSRVYFSSSVRTYAKVDRKNPTQHKLRSHQMDDSLKNLQSWLLRFSPVQFPKEICTVTFNRSTGPGGQNVNKLNTKATIRINVNDIEDKTNWPPEVIDALRAHRDTTKTGDVIITSERHRTQTMNLQDAWDKLFEFVKNIVELPGETSLMSIDRKEKLAKKDKARVREWKTEHSLKKQARRGKPMGRDMRDDF